MGLGHEKLDVYPPCDRPCGMVAPPVGERNSISIPMEPNPYKRMHRTAEGVDILGQPASCLQRAENLT